VKFFADASFLYAIYYPQQVFSTAASRLWERENLQVYASIAAILELRLGALWDGANEPGWQAFQADLRIGRVTEAAVNWDSLFSEFEPSVLQFGRKAQPRLLDGLHVLAARQIGATHFISFDHRSRQRAFARAIGLKVLPERLPGEYGS
jgi:predicted nucleic acid-binding protein